MTLDPVLLPPEEQSLPTLKGDGSRKWLKPRIVPGNYFRARRIVAVILLFVFTFTPFIKIGGEPFILLDIMKREFTILGYRFLATDTLLLALAILSAGLSIVLITAIFGRVWCGWACPQTVYLEFVYRPIERMIDGTIGRGGQSKKPLTGWRWFARYGLFLLVSAYLSHTFLAYFVGVDNLIRWIWQETPIKHPVPFIVVLLGTAAMMFNFSFFREQFCIVCPYGRFQSVLLDRQTSIVAYDKQRGEPRGKVSLPILGEKGDCVDCKLCVAVCPTGIDIRNGLQFECVNCTQCMDACNSVMAKVGKPKDLIRYSSQANDNGEPKRLIRPRVVVYPILLMIVAGSLLGLIFTKKSFDARITRTPGGVPFVVKDGEVMNMLRARLTNRSNKPMTISAAAIDRPDIRIDIVNKELKLDGYAMSYEPINIYASKKSFTAGKQELKLRLTSSDGNERIETIRLVGP